MESTIHHVDTSALIKLILHPDILESGSEALSEFRRSRTGFWTLDLCIGEALNVLKQMAFSKNDKRRKLSRIGYKLSIERLRTIIAPGHSLHPIDCDLTDNSLCRDALELTQRFEIDFVDALVVMSARRRRPWHRGQNLLITADNEMVKVAGDLGMPVWNCISDSIPKDSA